MVGASCGVAPVVIIATYFTHGGCNVNKYQQAHPEWFDEKGRVQPWVLRELIDYDPTTGEMIWKNRTVDWFIGGVSRGAEQECLRWNKTYSGKRAMTTNRKCSKNTFRAGAIFGVPCLAHSVVFAIQFNRYANAHHAEDGDFTNLIITNIKETSWSDIQKESKVFKNASASSRYFGVSFSKTRQRWTVTMRVNGKQMAIGTFKVEEDAADAYDRAALKYLGPTAYLNMAERPDVPEIDDEPVAPAPIDPAEAAVKMGDDF
ncbi:MAG: hypothetical protein E5W41_00230 [Mesorhizobium sp.]|nr:MAG: hypothetical protein E5W41_00230 [Mesorhizobium sp.]